MAKDIILLELYSKNKITLESSIVIITADAMMIMNNTASIVNDNCTDKVNIANDSYVWYSNWYE